MAAEKCPIDPNKTNTHTYDGKLTSLVTKILAEKCALSFPETVTQIRKNLEASPFPRKNEALHALLIFERDPNGNFDPSNNVRVEQLLPLLYQHIQQCWAPETLVLFYEQLADVIHGACAQGRCTRLLNLFPVEPEKKEEKPKV